MPQHILDFDGDSQKLVEEAYRQSYDSQEPRLNQNERDIWAYYSYADSTASGYDPNMPQVTLPKLFSILENKSPKDTKALFGDRPYFEWDAKREEFKSVAGVQVDMLDDLLSKASFFIEASMLVKMKTLYGTAFMSVLPYYEEVTEKSMEFDPFLGGQVITKKSHRLRLKLETWAPWEVLVDPFATGLENADQCRYIIKIQLVSKRMLKMMYGKGAYPALNIEELDEYSRGGSTVAGSRMGNEHFGLKISKSYGLKYPEGDDDIGILLRYESPDRYIDSWMGDVTLRDIPNPFNHKKINLSRMTHILPPHTQERFWGIGEAKPNEVQIALYNDLYQLTVSTHGLINQPVIFYREDPVNVDDLIWAHGQRIPIDSDSERPVSDDVFVHSGSGLPADHYRLLEQTERNIDLTAGEFEVQRGETAQTGTDTLGEVAFLKEAGDSRHEQVIRLGELGFCADFASKASSIVEQASNFDDAVEIVGEEKAFEMYTASPADLPGGFNFTFKGSDRIANLQLKQRRFLQLAPMLAGLPASKPDGIGRMGMKLFEFDKSEQEMMMYTEEEMDMVAQQLGQLAPELAMAEAEMFDSEQQAEGVEPETNGEVDKNSATKRQKAKAQEGAVA